MVNKLKALLRKSRFVTGSVKAIRGGSLILEDYTGARYVPVPFAPISKMMCPKDYKLERVRA